MSDTPQHENGRARAASGARLVALAPYLWLLLFFLVPFVIVLRISVSQPVVAQPPYLPLLDLTQGLSGIASFVSHLTVETYALLFTDVIYMFSYFKSVTVAAISTALLLVVGFPIAYAMARAPRRAQPVLVMLIILPFWTSFLIRIYAWINILQRDGLLNDVLLALGIVSQPLVWLSTDTAIYIGIVYSYLPFMVLPLYAALEKQDESLLEAAADLGCRRWQAFWLVTVPLAMRGVFAGALLCFIPVTGEFVIPDLLGGSDSMMIGQTLWVEFFGNRDWPVAAALAVVLIAVLVVPLTLYERMQQRELEGRR